MELTGYKACISVYRYGRKAWFVLNHGHKCICLLILVIMVIYGVPAMASGSETGIAAALPEKPITIVTATDLHHLSEDLTDGGEAFMNLLDAADGKITQYSTEVIETWIDDVITLSPDAVILTGDLTFNGEKRSHEDLARRLGQLENAGIPVLVLPGNHDLENRSARRFSGDQMYVTDSISAEEFADIYAQYGYKEALSTDPASLSYVYPLTDRLWILCIDVNTTDSPYYLKEETLSWIENILQKASLAQAKVICCSHQNLLIHNPLFFDGYQMGHADELITLYRKYGISLHLSGHMHVQHIAQEEKTASGEERKEQTEDGSERETGAGGGTEREAEKESEITGGSETVITDIATSSLTVAPLQYGILQLEQEQGRYSYHTRSISRTDLVSFAYQYFVTCTNTKTQAQLSSYDIPENVMEEMTKETARINYAYFSGRMDLISRQELNNLQDLWKQYAGTSFMQIYLLSLTQGEKPGKETSISGFW